jgi:hypothetical protein
MRKRGRRAIVLLETMKDVADTFLQHSEKERCNQNYEQKDGS